MKISVILLTYNRPEYFFEAYKSFLDQDVMDFDKELIIVQNGSTVKYPEIKEDKEIKIVDIKENTFNAINIGIENCTGDIITILHDDDLFYDELSLYNRCKSFLDSDIEVVFTSWVTMDKNGNKTSGVRDCGNVSLRDLLVKEYIYMPTMAWRNGLQLYFDSSFRAWSDYFFKVECLFKHNCKSIHTPTLLYRQHEGQESYICARNGINDKEKAICLQKIRNMIGVYL